MSHRAVADAFTRRPIGDDPGRRRLGSYRPPSDQYRDDKRPEDADRRDRDRDRDQDRDDRRDDRPRPPRANAAAGVNGSPRDREYLESSRSSPRPRNIIDSSVANGGARQPGSTVTSVSAAPNNGGLSDGKSADALARAFRSGFDLVVDHSKLCLHMDNHERAYKQKKAEYDKARAKHVEFPSLPEMQHKFMEREEKDRLALEKSCKRNDQKLANYCDLIGARLLNAMPLDEIKKKLDASGSAGADSEELKALKAMMQQTAKNNKEAKQAMLAKMDALVAKVDDMGASGSAGADSEELKALKAMMQQTAKNNKEEKQAMLAKMDALVAKVNDMGKQLVDLGAQAKKQQQDALQQQEDMAKQRDDLARQHNKLAMQLKLNQQKVQKLDEDVPRELERLGDEVQSLKQSHSALARIQPLTDQANLLRKKLDMVKAKDSQLIQGQEDHAGQSSEMDELRAEMTASNAALRDEMATIRSTHSIAMADVGIKLEAVAENIRQNVAGVEKAHNGLDERLATVEQQGARLESEVLEHGAKLMDIDVTTINEAAEAFTMEFPSMRHHLKALPGIREDLGALKTEFGQLEEKVGGLSTPNQTSSLPAPPVPSADSTIIPEAVSAMLAQTRKDLENVILTYADIIDENRAALEDLIACERARIDELVSGAQQKMGGLEARVGGVESQPPRSGPSFSSSPSPTGSLDALKTTMIGPLQQQVEANTTALQQGNAVMAADLGNVRRTIKDLQDETRALAIKVKAADAEVAKRFDMVNMEISVLAVQFNNLSTKEMATLIVEQMRHLYPPLENYAKLLTEIDRLRRIVGEIDGWRRRSTSRAVSESVGGGGGGGGDGGLAGTKRSTPLDPGTQAKRPRIESTPVGAGPHQYHHPHPHHSHGKPNGATQNGATTANGDGNGVGLGIGNGNRAISSPNPTL